MISLNELKLSLFLVWSILSMIILSVLIAPLFLSQDTILKLTPDCVSRTKYNRECPLCGMSRAFIAISEGNLGVAYFSNKAAIPTYLTFASNEILFLGLILATCIKKFRIGKELRTHCF